MTFPVQYLFGQPIGTTAGWILGAAAIAFPSDADYTLTPAEAAHNALQVTGTISTTRKTIVPIAFGQAYFVENSTTGGQSIEIVGPSGTGVTIANGTSATVVCDGTNYVAVSSAAGAPEPIAFNVPHATTSSATVIPAGANILRVSVFITTAFNAGTIEVGVAGTPALLFGTGVVDPTQPAHTVFNVDPQSDTGWLNWPGGAILATVAGAASGAVTVQVTYGVPTA